MGSAPLLHIDNLTVKFTTADGAVDAVSDLSLHISPGECLGVVGESGSGKSQTFMAALGLLAANGSARGRALFHGDDLLTLGDNELNAIRGDKVAMIFQDPMTSLTPHMTVGRQLSEVLIHHRGVSAARAREESLVMLKRVRVPDPERRLAMYPHELSGGLRQRVMIAMALLCGPELIIADEPTTALDVTVQAQILDLLREVKDTLHTAVVLITHDLGVIAGLADRVAVMYAGRIVEMGDVRQVFADPRHPYTRGLLACTPRMDAAVTGALFTIPGQPPNLEHLPAGCAFAPRCASVLDACRNDRPALRGLGGGRFKACIRDDLAHAS
ncbi:MAG: ABC transporter ATP-binding protein [Rhodospirillaceae bacterium]|nr:MAG: ABC transporter ATP-binding protein [Rhodospirillaceae bacterium]